MTKKEKMYQAIEKHGRALCEVFNLVDVDPIKLCKNLRRVETAGNRISTMWCNGEMNEKRYTEEENKLAKKAYKILGTNRKIYFNSDPRGYFLKLETKDHTLPLPRDLGGYYLLAPNLSL